MPNTREKLVDLLIECRGADPAYYGIEAQHIADHLIANGVGFREQDCHWATEQAYKNGKADALKWIPVAERLPEEDGKYLVFERGYLIPSIRVLSFAKDGRKVDKYDFHREWKNVWYRYDSEWGHLTIDVTHWMPLPPAPEDLK